VSFIRVEGSATRRPPPSPAVKRRVAIPSSLFVGEDRKLATLRLGLIARYLAIFRVEEVLVFGGDSDFVVDVLRYAETPPYLRQKLIPLKSALRYCGVIPPLQSPHHPPSPKGRGFVCEYREGIVLRTLTDAALVDVGLKEPILVQGRARPRERVTVIIDDKPRLVHRRKVPFYWGYEVSTAPNLRAAVSACEGYVKVATSRLGDPVRNVAEELVREAKRKGGVAVFFGERERGLLDIALEEGWDPKGTFDFIVNLVPNQGTFTIRTEEAIPITLAVLDFLLD